MSSEAVDRPQSTADAALIDESLAVIRKGKARAPADFLLALAGILGTLAVALLVGAVLADGILRDLLLNLGAEVIGALLTVVLIDGLWKRLEASASDRLDSLTAQLERRRGSAITDDERAAWRAFVDGYRLIERSESAGDRIRALRAYGKRTRDLEALSSRIEG